MATIGTGTRDVVCIPDEGTLPDGPFTALRYHFGMLLGVDDFSTEQRYHRGKMRLHNAWLHRAGIVWGLDVDVVQEKRELRVAPGLALDASGRELHLDVRCCMDIGAWYDEHEADVETRTPAGGGVQFDGRVELAFCACGTRPVPAIAGPCEGAEVDTAYSRTFETVSIRFVPELADPPPVPYPRLRLLFGLSDGVPDDLPDRAEVLGARADVLAQAPDDQPGKLLGYFRDFADRDTVALEPSTPEAEQALPLPYGDDAAIVLANLRDVTLEGSKGNWQLTSWRIDRSPRRAHVATHTIEELLCGRILGGESGGEAGSPSPDAGGPRVTDVQADRNARTITMTVDKPLDSASVGHEAFRVARLESGWEPLKVRSATLSGDGLSIVVSLRIDPGTSLLRFIARGTGQLPLLGADHVPFAGIADGPPGSVHDGHDFVHMFT